MAKKKNFYAVKTNEGNAILETWDETVEFKKGKKGVSYKGFATKEQAQAWLEGTVPVYLPITEDGRVTVYTDGSFNEDGGKYGWGFVAIKDGEVIHSESGYGDDPATAAHRNISGEMLAAMHAVVWARKAGFGTMEIRYDYKGVGDFPCGVQQPEYERGEQYRDWMKKASQSIAIKYVQVPGHSGDAYNEMADSLAYEACR